MRCGDIVFVRGHSPISKIIKYFDYGEFSHVALIIDDKHVLEAQRFQSVGFSHFNYTDYEIVNLGLTEHEREMIYLRSRDFIGIKYDYRMILGYVLRKLFSLDKSALVNNPNQFICSELIAYCLGRLDLVEKSPNELYRTLKFDIK